MGDFQGIGRSSVERGDREKSQSDERSISHGVGGQWRGAKVSQGKILLFLHKYNLQNILFIF